MSEGEGAWDDWLRAQGAPPANGGPAALLRAIRGHPLLIGLVALAAVLAAGLWQATRPSTYEATAEILVTPAPDDGGPDRSLPLLRESGDRTRIVQTAATLVDSEGAARRTADELGAGWTPERVAGAVTVEPVGQTDVLAVTAQADDPELATSVANTFAESALGARADMLRPRLDAFLRQVQRELEAQDDPSSAVALELTQRLSELRAVAAAGDPTLSLTRLATTGEGPVGTPSWIIVAAALIAGLAVGVGAALVIDLVAPGRIADPAQVSAMTEAPVLARVPVPRSAGGVPPAAVASAYRTVELQLPADAAGRRVVLVVSPSGEGAAACVADFGIALAQAGRDVLVVDLDGPGGSLAARFGDSTAPGGAQANGDAPPPLPRLRLLPVHAVRAGGGDPREPTDLLAAVSDRHDCVLVHAPALTESAEALRVAAVVQAVVLVVRLRRTSQTDLDLALRQLYSVDRVPAGVIVVSGWEHQRRSSLPAAPATIEPPSVAEPAPRQRRHAQPRPKRRS
jgi:polysaccharide biosynthesis transport protein